MDYHPSRTVSQTSGRKLSKFEVGFAKLSYWFVVYNGQGVGVHSNFWYQVYRASSSRIQCCNNMSQFVKVTVSIIFHVPVTYIFQAMYCTISKRSVGLTHCRLRSYSFSFAIFISDSPRRSHSLKTHIFLSWFVFLIKIKMHEPILSSLLFSFFCI